VSDYEIRPDRSRGFGRQLLENRASPLSMFQRKGADGKLQGWSMIRVLLGCAMWKWMHVEGWDRETNVGLLIILATLPAETLAAAVPLTEVVGFVKAKASSAIDVAMQRARDVAGSVVERTRSRTDTEKETVLPPANPEEEPKDG
jgi:hypothetical protein